MVNTIAVWGDSVLKGVIVDNNTKKYEKLNEKGCIPCVSKKIHIPIVNNSKFGMTSEKGKVLLERAFQRQSKSDVTVICFGGNDVDHNWQEIADNPSLEQQPKVPLERFCDNMSQMVRTVLENDSIPVLVTIPPIDSEEYFKWFSKNIENSANILEWLGEINCIYRMQEMYNDAIIKIAKNLNCRLIDIRQAFLQKHNFANYLCIDGIHPNENGHRLMEQVFLAYANENLN